jgi:hypothetical protein
MLNVKVLDWKILLYLALLIRYLLFSFLEISNSFDPSLLPRKGRFPA